MATEIERKFLVSGDGWRGGIEYAAAIRQAYLALTPTMNVRVRIQTSPAAGDKATLTIKSANPGRSRSEFEYPLPLADAVQLLELRSGLVIEKQRHIVPVGADRWEIDVFAGELPGLVIAELEQDTADAPFDPPAWLGREVTDDHRYYNADLALNGLPGS